MPNYALLHASNRTPLTINITRSVAAGKMVELGKLEPLGQREFEIEQLGEVVARDAASGLQLMQVAVDRADVSLAVTPEGLRSAPPSGPVQQLTIQNTTRHYLDVQWNKSDGTTAPLGRIAPGEAMPHQGPPGQCLLLRDAFTKLLADVVITGATAATVKIKSGFIEKQQAQANRTDPQFGELKLVGGARAVEPRSSNDYIVTSERWFLPDSRLPEEKPFVRFNTLESQMLRRIEISGVDLIFDGKQSRLLNAYTHGTDLSMRSLTIYADRVTIAVPLKFPRTDVAIYARELTFEGDGCIDTTPHKFEAPACSRRYVKHDNGKVYPADDAGNIVYKGADGADGEPAGKIELFVKDIRGLAKTRFVAHGSNGQAAEDGGLQPYKQRSSNQPEDGKNVKGLKFEDVNNLIRNKEGVEPWKFSWPGTPRGGPNVDWPGRIPSQDLQNKIYAGSVGHVRVGVIRYRVPAQAYSGYHTARLLFLPSWTDVSASFVASEDDGLAWVAKNADPAAPVPGQGEDAYPSGKPGKSGNGGAVISHFVPVDQWVDLAAGEPGQSLGPGKEGKSKEIPGGEAGKPVWHVTLNVFDRDAQNDLDPNKNCILREIPGAAGQSAKGVTQSEKASAGKVAAPDMKPELGWLHENALEAVLTYARDAFRRGRRDIACSTLEPYFAILSAAAATPDRLEGQWIALEAMRTNLIQSVDYYGNPPSWVPRLAVTTNYAAFQTIRQTASETLYFALRMADDYDGLEKADELAARATAALEADLGTLQARLQEAYHGIDAARQAIDKVQNELNLKGQALLALKNRVEQLAAKNVKEQRAYSAAMQMIGGLMNVFPFGQPVLGGIVGNLFTVASEFDWNKEDPFKEGAKKFEEAGKSVTSFIEKNKKLLGKVDPSPVRAGKEEKLHISTQLANAQSALGSDTDKIREVLAGLDLKQRDAVLQRIKELQEAIPQAVSTLNTLSEDARQIGATAFQQSRASLAQAMGASTSRALATYSAELGKLQAQRGEMSRKILSLKGFKPEELANAVTVSDKAIADLLKHSAGVDALKTQQTQAKLQVQQLKLQQSAAEENRKTLIESLTNVGEGVGQIGAAFVRLAAPFNIQDPAIQSLMKRMLESKDSEFHNTYSKLQEDLLDLARQKQSAAEKLMQCHQEATTATSQLSGTLAALSKVSQQRQSMSGALDAGTRIFLRSMQQRAKEALGQSIYYFVQAYQYEFLNDVSDDFFTFDTWVERLRKLETERQKQADANLAAARQEKTPDPAKINKLEQEAARPTRLSEKDFQEIEANVLQDQLLGIFVKLLANRQSQAGATQNVYKDCVLSQPMLDKLNATGRVRFNFVRDFKKGQFSDIDFRASSVDIAEFTAETSDKTLSLRLRIRHSGESVILNKVEGKRVYYAFRAALDDAPIEWSFTWNSGKIKADRRKPTAIDSLLQNLLEKSKVTQIEEYKPSLFSDFQLLITNFDDALKGRLTVKRVNLSVKFQDRGSADGPALA